MPSKSRAMGYTDYYKNSTNTPSSQTPDTEDDEVNDAAARRKAAIQRRLRMRRAGK